MADIAGEIPAIKELDSADLRGAVIAAWTASMDRSPYASLADVPQSPLPLMTARPLLLHVNEVNDLALYFLDLAVARFDVRVDRDAALATAILHDVDKPMIYRRGDGPELDYAPGTKLSDHGAIGAELAARHGVPVTIVEMIRVHSPFASDGLPGTPEGTIVHYADFVANDLACQQQGAPPIHSSFDLHPKPGRTH
jgi:putative nucleotidyltransferase with HDIG domain